MRRSNSFEVLFVFYVEMATGEDDVVAELLLVPFSRRPFSENMDIIKKGHPTQSDCLRDVHLTRTTAFSNPGGGVSTEGPVVIDTVRHCHIDVVF